MHGVVHTAGSCHSHESNCTGFWSQPKIQNICLRFIFDYRAKDECDYNKLLKKLNWLNMKNRRIMHGLTMIYKILNGLAPNYLRDSFTLTSEIHNVNTRTAKQSIYINKGSTSKLHRKSYTFYLAKIYNDLPENIQKSVSVDSFKNAIKKFIMEEKLVIPNI